MCASMRVTVIGFVCVCLLVSESFEIRFVCVCVCVLCVSLCDRVSVCVSLC